MFELACPWILSLLPLPWLIWRFAPKRSLPPISALNIPFFQAMNNLINQDKQSIGHRTTLLLLSMTWMAMVIALAGPRWVGEPTPLVRKGYHILLALDLSGSMALQDRMMYGHPATRLAVVKRAARQFVRDRVGDNIGLIVFGSQAYLQTPLTYDRHNVIERINDATVGLAGQTTSIGDALGLAVKQLQRVPINAGRFLILLTDGVSNSGVLTPFKAAELAKQEGIKVYTIGLGTEQHGFGSLLFDVNATAELDEDTLKSVASMTGGLYFRATDLASLQKIYGQINKIEAIAHGEATVRPEKDYYPWPLALAILLGLLLLTKRFNPS